MVHQKEHEIGYPVSDRFFTDPRESANKPLWEHAFEHLPDGDNARKGTMRKPLSTFAWPWTCGRASCKPLPACFVRFLSFFCKHLCFIDCFSGGKLLQEEDTLLRRVLSRVIFYLETSLVDPCQALVSRGFCYLAQGEEELDVTFAFFFPQITGCVIGLHRFVFEKPDCDRCPVLFRNFFWRH